jgi:hypothetical protein
MFILGDACRNATTNQQQKPGAEPKIAAKSTGRTNLMAVFSSSNFF